MPRSGIRAFMDLAWAAKDVIHLEVGEPNFPTPPHIVAAAARLLRDRIRSGEYKPGDELPPSNGLARDHGMIAHVARLRRSPRHAAPREGTVVIDE